MGLSNSGMSPSLVREGDGRYAVQLGEFERAGLVLGGNGKWSAEAPGGHVLGYFPSRAQAVETVVADATEPSWRAMQSTAQAAGLPKHYRTDLDIDRAQVRQWGGCSDFLWMLRESGTNLLPLDVQWLREGFAYRLDLYEREKMPFELYLVCARSAPGVVKRISLKQARAMLAKPARFALDSRRRAVVMQPGNVEVATMDVTGNARSAAPDAVVTVQLRVALQWRDQPALLDAAQAMLEHHAGSLFVAPKAVRVLRDPSTPTLH